MNTIKKYLGIVWIVLAAFFAYYIIANFGGRLSSPKMDDLIFGIIMFFILMPLICTGLAMFGIFSLMGEFDEEY